MVAVEDSKFDKVMCPAEKFSRQRGFGRMRFPSSQQLRKRAWIRNGSEINGGFSSETTNHSRPARVQH